MAYTTQSRTEFSIARTLTAPFRGLWTLLSTMAEHRPFMRELERLNALSDADLAARGTNRQSEVRRIFGTRMLL